MLLGQIGTYKDLAPYAGGRSPPKASLAKLPSQEPGLLCVAPRGADPELTAVTKHLTDQDRRLHTVEDALEANGDLYEDLRASVDEMRDELSQIQAMAGQAKARQNVKKATQAVLHLTDTFDQLDRNASGSIDVAELRRGLHLLGMDSHSAQANAIIDRYTHDQSIDVKVFATLVRDIHTLLSFDKDGSGTLDAAELKPALKQLGLEPSDRNIEKIRSAWDADNSGMLDLLEFTDLVRTLQTFQKYDKDNSGDIDVDELRPALRRLGVPADTEMTNAIIKWYDHDSSGRIELHEFAVLARDASVFATFDRDHSGTLDEQELLPALAKLGLAASEKEVRDIILTWDDNQSGCINLLEFAEIVRDLQVFEQFDVDRSGFISTAELRIALSKLGVQMSHPETADLLHKYDADKSGTIEFSEFRQLAEELPSLVGREKDSFFKLHNNDKAYVHAEDVNSEDLVVDLNQTFKKSSMKKSDTQSHSSTKGRSVLGGIGGTTSVLGGSILGAATGAPPTSVFGSFEQPDDSNPFNSRMFGSGKRDSMHRVRGVRLLNSEKEKLAQSKSILRD
mmetsp:Transcript_20812/g.53106  ORF Transcript_20812/g.53106 Transcript_20812/m.53106 type:complete len:565 (-) Transcript_20812:409-2103(-)